MESVGNIDIEPILQKFYEWELEHRITPSDIRANIRTSKRPDILGSMLCVFLDEVIKVRVDDIEALEDIMLELIDKRIVNHYNELYP